MKRYVIWNKTDDIYTLGKDAVTGKSHWTAQEYIDNHAPWAAIPTVKVIVGGGHINGTVFMEFDTVVDLCKKQQQQIRDLNPDFDFGEGEIVDGMTDREILDAIEYFEDHPLPPEPSPEERIAAALEFSNVLNM